MEPVDTKNAELISMAKAVIAQRYREGFHHLGSAVRGSSGKIYGGIHLEADVGRASVCAEAVAIGSALAAGETRLEAVVTVRRAEGSALYNVVSPCGVCRELMATYMPEGLCLMVVDDRLTEVPVSALLPGHYRRRTSVVV